MTCVVGLVHRNRIYMGADTATSSSNGRVHCGAVKKVARTNDVVWGVAGDADLCTFTVELFKPPAYNGLRPNLWVKRVFEPALMAAMRDAKQRVSLGAELEILIGVGGVLIDTTIFGETCTVDGLYDAIGEGAELARGSLAETARFRPETRVRRALQVAAELPSVCEPFNFVSVRPLKYAARRRRGR